MGFIPLGQHNSGNSTVLLLRNHLPQTQTCNSKGGCHSSCFCPNNHKGKPVTQARTVIPSYPWPQWIMQEIGTDSKPGKIHAPSQMGQLSFLVIQGRIYGPGRKMKTLHKENWGPGSNTPWQLPRVLDVSDHSFKFSFSAKLVPSEFIFQEAKTNSAKHSQSRGIQWRHYFLNGLKQIPNNMRKCMKINFKVKTGWSTILDD